MKLTWKTSITIILLLATVGALLAQPILTDRKNEQESYPDLQITEKNQEKNILNVYKRLGRFGRLVELAQEDRMKNFKEVEEPNDFRHTIKNIKYTPRNTYFRYVREDPEFLLVGLGTTTDIQARINERIGQANAAGVQIKDFQFQQREGIELTAFDFIKEQTQNAVLETVGSQRKSLSLFYRQANQAGAQDEPQQLELDLAVIRNTEDHQRDGVKDVEIIIDPTPMDDNLDDIIVIHRYNMKVPRITLLGALSNTPSFPLRNKFKQKYYVKLLDHFYRLYRLVDNYAYKDDNDYGEDLNEKLENSLDY